MLRQLPESRATPTFCGTSFLLYNAFGIFRLRLPHTNYQTLAMADPPWKSLGRHGGGLALCAHRYGHAFHDLEAHYQDLCFNALHTCIMHSGFPAVTWHKDLERRGSANSDSELASTGNILLRGAHCTPRLRVPAVAAGLVCNRGWAATFKWRWQSTPTGPGKPPAVPIRERPMR